MLIAVLCVPSAPLAADDSTQANRLLVEAVKLIQTAGTKQTAGERLPLVESALAKLNEIVENHPSSDLAVKLITGQQIGDISLASVADAVEILSQLQKKEAARTTCIESLDVTDPECREWLYDIGRAQLQAGDLQGARKTARWIRDSSVRRDLLREISVRAEKHHLIALAQAERVGNQLRAGNLQGALATARSIEYISIRDQALRDVAEGQAQAGNLDDALATAESIEADHVRTRILDVIKRRTQ